MFVILINTQFCMVYLSISYRVEDFKIWYETFREKESTRIQYGLKVEHIFREREDNNEIIIIYSAEDKKSLDIYIKELTKGDYVDRLRILTEMKFKYLDVFLNGIRILTSVDCIWRRY